MLKRTFLGVLFAVFVSGLLIAGINFDVTKAADYGGSGTSVGGIIWENTTWTLEDSPYTITDTVQIPENVTLTIEPGVTVTKPTTGDMFLLHGTIYAHGTINKKILFDGGGNSEFFTTWGGAGNAFLNYCIIRNGYRFWNRGGYFNLTRSELTNLTSSASLQWPSADVYIEYNKFIDTGGIGAYDGYDSKVYVRYNLFKSTTSPIKSAGKQEIIVEKNSFIDIDGIVLMLDPYWGDWNSISAPENYWGTQDTDIIDSMIYDRNDDINCGSYIDYLPILSEPHPATPIMLEDVKVNINGIFRKDDDGKWRCYANITIKNNSYRNVTIWWVYLNAINITYIDENFEELDISGNETLNYVIQPEQGLSVGWTVTTFGFTKEPKILWVLLKTPISEAYGTITLTTVIPEFPSLLILPSLMILSIFAVILAREHVLKHQKLHAHPSVGGRIIMYIPLIPLFLLNSACTRQTHEIGVITKF